MPKNIFYSKRLFLVDFISKQNLKIVDQLQIKLGLRIAKQNNIEK